MTEGSRSACPERLIFELAVGNESVGKTDHKPGKSSIHSNDYYEPSILDSNRFIFRAKYYEKKLPTISKDNGTIRILIVNIDYDLNNY